MAPCSLAPCYASLSALQDETHNNILHLMVERPLHRWSCTVLQPVPIPENAAQRPFGSYPISCTLISSDINFHPPSPSENSQSNHEQPHDEILAGWYLDPHGW